ncbi:hypothetical protein D3C72_693610 [compost metagenome]
MVMTALRIDNSRMISVSTLLPTTSASTMWKSPSSRVRTCASLPPSDLRSAARCLSMRL